MGKEPALGAEILKLARLLRCDPERLSYLEQVPASDISRLREQVTEMLFSAHDRTLSKLAAAGKILPVAVVSAIAERAFGPILVARMAGYVEPARAVEIAARLPAGFLADVACEIDPRRTSKVIAGIPAERIAELTRILADRREFVTMGQCVSQLSAEALRAALAVLGDEEILRAAFVMEDKRRLPELAELLDHDRTIRMIDVAQEAGLEEEALDLLDHLDGNRRAEVVRELSKRDDVDPQVLDQLSRGR